MSNKSPHTLKVNELPSHSHNTPGIEYKEIGTSKMYLQFTNGFFQMLGYSNNDSNWKSLVISDATVSSWYSGLDNRYRSMNVGGRNDGSPTTEKGNNEHSKKQTYSPLFKNKFPLPFISFKTLISIYSSKVGTTDNTSPSFNLILLSLIIKGTIILSFPYGVPTITTV